MLSLNHLASESIICLSCFPLVVEDDFSIMIIQYLKYDYSISAGLDIKKIERCMGDPNADSENPVLKEEQDAQVLLYFIN